MLARASSLQNDFSKSVILFASALTFVKNKTGKWWATPPTYLTTDNVRATPNNLHPGLGYCGML